MQPGIEEVSLTYSERQAAQLRRFMHWVKSEGGVEWPTAIDTLLTDRQQARLAWLKRNTLGSVLEVGCNWGYVLAYVKGEAGLDINEANIELARVLAPERRFEVGDATHLPFITGGYDTVMLPEVLEHLDFPYGVLKAVEEAKRVARMRVLITMPDGRQDSHDANNFKHAWVLDQVALDTIKLWLPGWSIDFAPALSSQKFALIRWDRR